MPPVFHPSRLSILTIRMIWRGKGRGAGGRIRDGDIDLEALWKKKEKQITVTVTIKNFWSGSDRAPAESAWLSGTGETWGGGGGIMNRWA